jgi:hypothetical protein
MRLLSVLSGIAMILAVLANMPFLSLCHHVVALSNTILLFGRLYSAVAKK